MSRESPSNTLVGSHGMGCNRSMWKLSFNCQLCPSSWSQPALQTGLPISTEMPAQFCRSSAPFYIMFVLCGTALNAAACLSFFSPLLLACFHFVLCFFHRIVHLFALPLCLVSRLWATSQCREFIVLPRHSEKSSHSEPRERFFKGKTMLSTASCLYSTGYKQCPLWHPFISYCLWQGMNQGREKLWQRSKLEPVERESKQAGQMSKATGNGKTS